jgi:hypothetical protein
MNIFSRNILIGDLEILIKIDVIEVRFHEEVDASAGIIQKTKVQRMHLKILCTTYSPLSALGRFSVS